LRERERDPSDNKSLRGRSGKEKKEKKRGNQRKKKKNENVGDEKDLEVGAIF
jgi:hypothetical protein